MLFVKLRSGDGKATRAGLAERARDTRIEARGARPPLDSGQLRIVILDVPGDSPRSGPSMERAAPGDKCLGHRSTGIDSESVDLDPPLRFASRPASLRVRISPRHPGASPSARLALRRYPSNLKGEETDR